MKRFATFFPLLIAGLLALATWWLQYSITSIRGLALGNDRGDPDTIVSNFHVDDFDKGGRLSMSLEAPQLMHFPKDDSAEVFRPVVHFLRTERKSTWHSDKARIIDKGDTVFMTGNVQGLREGDAGSEPMILRTQSLTLLTRDEIARTSEPLTVVDGRMHIDAVGGEWNNITGVLKLQQLDATIERRTP